MRFLLQPTITYNSGRVKKLPASNCDLETGQNDVDGDPDDKMIAIFNGDADPQWRDYDLSKIKSITFTVVREK